MAADHTMTDPHIRQTIDALGERGCSFLASGRLEEAVDTLTRAFRMHASEFGSGHPDGLMILMTIATTFGLQGKCGDVCEICDGIVGAADRLDTTIWGRATPASLQSMARVLKARSLSTAGRHAEADAEMAGVWRIIAQAPELPSHLELQALVTQVQCAFSRGDMPTTFGFARRALDVLRTAALEAPVKTSMLRELAQVLSVIDVDSADSAMAWEMAQTAASQLPDDNMLRLYVDLDTAVRKIRQSPVDSAEALRAIERRVIRTFGHGHSTHQIVQANLVDALMQIGQHDEAVSILREIHRQAQTTGRVESHIGRWVLRDLALGLVRQGHYVEASSLLEQWIRISDVHRVGAGDATKRSLQSAHLGVERAGIALAVCRIKLERDVAEVFEAIERTSARGVADIVSQQGASLPQLAINARESGQWTAEHTEEFLALAKCCEDADAELRLAEKANAASSLDTAWSRLLSAEALIRPMAAELVPIGRPPSLDEVRDALRPGEVLLQLADSTDSVLVLTSSDYTGPVPRSWVLIEHHEQSVADLRNSAKTIVRYACGTEPLEEARRAALHIVQTVFTADVQAEVNRANRLVVSLGASFRMLSLDMLGDLAGIESWAHKATTYVPSASTFAFLRRKAATRPSRSISLGAAGDVAYGPPKPGAERSDAGSGVLPLPRSASEIADVARMFRNPSPGLIALVTGPHATEPRIRDALRGKSFIHIATHGTRGPAYDRHGPSLLCAPSANSEHITLQAILTSWGGELRDAELVALSACWSDATPTVTSDALGLALGFLHAGARFVLASPLPVPDLPTWLLMRRFYELLLGAGGADAASLAARAPDVLVRAKLWLASLSAAELGRMLDETPLPDRFVEFQDAENAWFSSLRTDSPFAEPRHWAGFRLIGG